MTEWFSVTQIMVCRTRLGQQQRPRALGMKESSYR